MKSAAFAAVLTLCAALPAVALETGGSVDFKPGDTIVEARGQWHTGMASTAGPVVLLVIDQTPPGKANTERKEP
jgi:quercetin dioxygenase-like cupin family protein